MILHIDPADEINTIVQRMKRSEDQAILMIIPDECRVLRDRNCMQLLVKYAKDFNKDLRLQTNDPLVIKEAEIQGVEVWQDMTASTHEDDPEKSATPSKPDASSAEDSPQKKRKKASRRKRQWRDRIVVLLFIISGLLGLVYVNMPRALVVITPNNRDFTERVIFEFSRLAGVDLVQTNVAVTRKTPATGRKTVGIQAATGVVILVNQNKEDVVVPRGTIVKTGNGEPFMTIKEVVVPAVETQFFMDVPTGLRAGQGEVGIVALNSGTKGNVAAGRIQTIVGYLLDVRNPEATQGGIDTTLSVATDQDVQRVKDSVLREIRQLTLTKLYEQIGNGMVLEDTLEVDVDWKEQTVVGTETDEVSVSTVGNAQIYVVDSAKLTNQAKEALKHVIPTGFQLLPDTLEIQNITVQDVEGWRLTLTVTGLAQGFVDLERITQRLLGSTVQEVAQVAANHPEILEITVEQSTGNRLPRYSRWLQVVLQ